MADAPDLLPRLAAFARLLHDAGLDAGPGRLATATRALGEIELRDQAAFRDSLRACFVSRKEEVPLFEAAFDIFWAPPDPRIVAGVIPGRSRSLPLPPERVTPRRWPGRRTPSRRWGRCSSPPRPPQAPRMPSAWPVNSGLPPPQRAGQQRWPPTVKVPSLPA